MPDLRINIRDALALLANEPLRQAATRFFHALGYKSDRTLDINTVAELQAAFDPNALLNNSSALIDRWRSVSPAVSTHR